MKPSDHASEQQQVDLVERWLAHRSLEELEELLAQLCQMSSWCDIDHAKARLESELAKRRGRVM